MVGPENASIRALTRQDGYQTITILNYHTDPLFRQVSISLSARAFRVTLDLRVRFQIRNDGFFAMCLHSVCDLIAGQSGLFCP